MGMSFLSHIFPRLAARPSSPPWSTLVRTLSTLILHGTLLVCALFLAMAVRFDLRLTVGGQNWLVCYFLPLFPVVVSIKLAVFAATGVHRGTWRYVSLSDLFTLVTSSLIAVALTFAILFGAQSFAYSLTGHHLFVGLPEIVFLLDALFGILIIAAARISTRLLFEEARPNAAHPPARLLIIGAGDAAEMLLRELNRLPEHPYRVVGLLDDSPLKQKLRIHGVPVLGTIEDLPQMTAKHHIAEILIALPNAPKDQMQRIVALCRSARTSSTGESLTTSEPLRFRIVPSMADLIAGRGTLHQIRDVSVNDVLGRDAVQTDLAAVGGMVHQQVVLVSGAGGSIGSELCRTIASFSPKQLVLVDKAENAIFHIERELRRSFPTLAIVAALGDISDPIRVDQIFAEYQPVLVFHAAAHKHVPLAELNPGEAIRNNVFGTKTLADTSLRYGVRNFVMISTDKAVNPTSIMGATKRCAEIYIQSLARRAVGRGGEGGSTNFITVRFGNVLGSNGSVVPIFKQQIAEGGPLTVTHPEMRRYFMTIPEAAQLVLQAGALGQRGEIFLLDMGQPVRILDLARDLIMLSGLRPDIDIPIVFTGLRPGEKLYEELSIRGEDMQPTRHPKIAVWKSTVAAGPFVQEMIDTLETLQHCPDRNRVLGALTKYLPEMKPWAPEPGSAIHTPAVE